MSLDAYQVQEPGGLLGSLSSATPAYAPQKPHIAFEKRSDGSPSNVMSINGKQAFVQGLVTASMHKPVVIFVHSTASADSQKMKPIFQEVADMFKGQVVFASLDLLAKYDNVMENDQILTQIMQNENISRLELPLFLFLKDASLYTPAHLAPAILHGTYTKENLSQFIQNKFFPSEETLEKTSVPSYDFIMTTTDAHKSNVDFVRAPSQAVQKKEPQKTPSLKERFLRFFNMKK
jgi:hypothetical protein